MKKLLHCKVDLLDGGSFEDDLEKNATGQDLLIKVCEFLRVVESEYFGLTYKTKGNKFWLRDEKLISKQIKGEVILVAFAVKYYMPEPLVILDEMARYQLFLQLRTDILWSRLPCSFVALALLGSFAVQSQIGDHHEKDHGDGINYIKSMQFSQSSSNELLEKISELHKTHSGLLPVEAEMNFLENAKSLALYGVHMHPAKEVDGSEISIGVCATGILIYSDKLRVNRFVWAKIIMITFKGNSFIIKVRKSELEDKDQKYVYKLESMEQAKNLWKLAVDHHRFFRMKITDDMRVHFERQKSVNEQVMKKSFDEEQVETSNTLRSLQASVQKSQMGLQSTERSEEHVEEWIRNATLDGQKLRASSRSFSNFQRNQALSNEETSGIQRLQSLQFKYDQNQRDKDWNEDWGDYDEIDYHDGYIGDVGGRHRYNDDQYAESSSHSQYGQKNKKNSKGFSYGVQEQEIEDRVSPKWIFQDVQSKQQDHRAYNYDGNWEDYSEEERVDENPWSDETKEEKRVYTTSDGVQVTEYRILRGGVIETYIEKRNTQTAEDFDKMLSDAIRSETGVDTDLSVQKIEIRADIQEC